MSDISDLYRNRATRALAHVRVLVVAGGGGGGKAPDRTGGGGGGGGVLHEASYTVGEGATVVSVGTGGLPDENGGNSVFATLTAIGGGHGGKKDVVPSIGGSGGGGFHGGNQAGAVGTADQGHAGGAGYDSGATTFGAGGGGGAGGDGATATITDAGDGGVGLAYDISGSSVYYAGGGGGGANRISGDITAGVGGNGGGGNGSQYGAAATNGTPATGGGGGGGSDGVDGGTGGNGVVIISYMTGSVYAIGGIVTQAGGNTIHTFASNGSFVVLSMPKRGLNPLAVQGGSIRLQSDANALAVYNCDEGAGTVLGDKSLNGRHGLISGCSWGTTGPWGKSLVISTGNNYVTITAPSRLGGLAAATIEVVAVNVAASPTESLYAESLDNTCAFRLWVSGDGGKPQFECLIGDTWYSLTAPSPIDCRNPFYVAATMDSAVPSRVLYVNGSAVANDTDTQRPTPNLSRIGTLQPNFTGYEWNGSIYMVRLSSIARTAAEILTNAQLMGFA